ncbi:hypothetical protein D9758_007993 [Tetrapyrgos nigripes]|uniref:C2H2-type domain-containing protein n=1 Tax=Tetrapyrgos nigripes TaxID=182062 RepID=A0A8H5D238_9AGAR|nr:hypothetical protein D9758_007993 [Tetrapyrgos nigripes]
MASPLDRGATISSFAHLSSSSLSHNKINTAGRDLHQTTHNHHYYQILEDPNGWRMKACSSISEIVWTSFQGIVKLVTGGRGSPSIEITSRENVEALDELFDGGHYRVHSGKHKGVAVLVKVFHGSRAKEHHKAAVAFSEGLLHPSMLRMTACSFASQSPFIVYGDDCERGPVDYCVASALTEGIPRILQLGFQLVGGLSAGLDYLSTVVGVSLGAIGKENFEVYITKGDQVKVGLGSCKFESGSKDAVADWELFNDLCTKLFEDANRLLYNKEGQESSLFGASVIVEDDMTTDTIEESSPAPRHSRSGSQQPLGSPAEPVPMAPRREVQWKRSSQRSTLALVARQFRNNIRISQPTRSSLRKLKATRAPGTTHHRCSRYSKEEITLTSVIRECALISGEVCLVCHSTPLPTDDALGSTALEFLTDQQSFRDEILSVTEDMQGLVTVIDRVLLPIVVPGPNQLDFFTMYDPATLQPPSSPSDINPNQQKLEVPTRAVVAAAEKSRRMDKAHGKLVYCPHCGYSFISSQHLRYHVYSHLGIKDFWHRTTCPRIARKRTSGFHALDRNPLPSVSTASESSTSSLSWAFPEGYTPGSPSSYFNPYPLPGEDDNVLGVSTFTTSASLSTVHDSAPSLPHTGGTMMSHPATILSDQSYQPPSSSSSDVGPNQCRSEVATKQPGDQSLKCALSDKANRFTQLPSLLVILL